MMENSAAKCEKLYELEFGLTGITAFGVSLDEILICKYPIPPQGARFDLAVSGEGTGRIAGKARGFDYPRFRADGRIELDLHVTIETDDGHRIALAGDGQAVPRENEPVLDIFANIRLSTAAKAYDRVNTRQIWTVGTASTATRKIVVTAYM